MPASKVLHWLQWVDGPIKYRVERRECRKLILSMKTMLKWELYPLRHAITTTAKGLKLQGTWNDRSHTILLLCSSNKSSHSYASVGTISKAILHNYIPKKEMYFQTSLHQLSPDIYKYINKLFYFLKVFNKVEVILVLNCFKWTPVCLKHAFNIHIIQCFLKHISVFL